jgi:hypothetical protein
MAIKANGDIFPEYKIKAKPSSETSTNFYQTTGRHVPEEYIRLFERLVFFLGY